MDNFRCSKCDKSFFIINYRIFYKHGIRYYKDKDGNALQCPICNNDLEYIEKEGEFNANFASFSSMSDSEKKSMLRKRSRDHFNKHLKGRKEYLDKNFTGTIKDVDF
jgi:hypothetical protein